MLLSLLWGTAVATGPEVERTAVVVGANEAPPGRARLRYAYHDAERVAQTLIEVGGFSEDQVIVLRDPEPTELLDTLAQVPASDMLVFFYSGHADDHQLFPSGAPLAIQTLQATLDRVPAKLRVGVLDACRGGGWTGTKGLVAAPSFPLPKPTQQGTVYLAASSGAEDAHEADVVSGGFFTHHWTAGLRGPADANADGRVTIDESFAYARAYTVRDSTVYAGEPQHPSFKMELRGRDPVVLADLRSQRSTLE
ncbi:MAG: caspase family protein, partial [Myxococcota bacterium]